MVVRIDERLKREIDRYRLVFACPDCAQFDPTFERCTFGYPIDPHKSADLDGREELTFCKSFELL
jgi:hypothetical protein